MSIKDTIARAIKKADKSYFFENYSKQAKAVITELEKSGYKIVPIRPTADMVKAGSDAIVGGKVKPSNHVQTIYHIMLHSVDTE